MFKKIVCAAIMTALLVSQAVGAFAAGFTKVDTTTTYDATNKQVAVTTTVSGVEKDDEITYLAYTGEDVTDESIAYIDQKTVTEADGSQIAFEYVADFKFNGSKVMVGGLDKSANAAYTVNDDGKINAKTTVILSGPTKYLIFNVDPVTEDTGFTKLSDGYDESGNADKAVVDGEKLHLDGVPVTWFAAADGIWIANSALKGQTQVKFGWEGTAPEIAATPKIGAVKNIDDKLLVLATKAANAKEYGIKVSKKAFAGLTVVDALGTYTVEEEGEEVTKTVTAADLADKVVKYAALGTDADGNYVVAIEKLVASGETYNVAAYSDTADTDVTVLEVK